MGYWTPSMESCSSGEEVVMKARKPYTITKQRERWTEEEHNRFLEALKLYGRAWQRIEEHIGTKTAIQIRSHAQKFFTKLEKEALSKGIPPGQTLDIDIPPPRPKRKPSNPYPRKSGVVASSSTKEEKQDKSVVASQSQCPNVEVSESGKGAPDAKPDRMGTLENATEARENGACTEVLPLFNDLLTSVNSKRNSGHPLIVGEFIPKSQKEKKGKTITNKMVTASEENGESKHHTSDVGDANICRLEGRHINSQAKMTPLERLNKHKQPEKLETPSTNNAERVEHVPMHPIHETKDGGEAACSDLRNTVPVPSINPQAAQMNTNTLRNPSISTAPVHQTGSSVSFFHQLPSFPPFFLPQGQDAYQSVSNASSTFSNFIVSTLVQNPAAHAAATAAVSFWPPQDSDKSKNFIPETTNGTIPGGHVNPHPSMAAIAADTVAAATAWWAMHGLFPLCHPPFPTGFPFVSAATTTSPIVTASQVKEKQERRNNLSRIHPEKDKSTLNSKLPEHLMLRCSASKSAPSSESDESRGHKRPDGTNLKSSGTIKLASTRDTTFRESNSKEGNKKRKEDFCCDYCKHSGSDATDTIEEDLQSKEKQQEFLVHHTSTVETSFTRCRHSVNCVNESRKEGRLAFQALFSREELPQSFSPPPPKDGAIKQCGDLGAATPPVDLNNNSHAYSSENDHCSGSDDVHARNNDCLEKSTSICEKGNLKSEAHRMGFKPYKRCSMEANVGRINSEEEKGGKRLHMEGKTSNL